jgi:hypothetical protein
MSNSAAVLLLLEEEISVIAVLNGRSLLLSKDMATNLGRDTISRTKMHNKEQSRKGVVSKLTSSQNFASVLTISYCGELSSTQRVSRCSGNPSYLNNRAGILISQVRFETTRYRGVSGNKNTSLAR